MKLLIKFNYTISTEDQIQLNEDQSKIYVKRSLFVILSFSTIVKAGKRMEGLNKCYIIIILDQPTFILQRLLYIII